MTTTAVRPGQIWRDNDKRAYGRQVRVVETDATHAVVVQHVPRGGARGASHLKPRRTRIRLDRFRPTSTGYTLLPTCRRCGHSEADHGNASGADRWYCASCGHGDYHPFYPEEDQPVTAPAQPDPAAELRAAAALIRERVSAATPGPWIVDNPAYATGIYGPGRGPVAVVAGGRWGGKASVFECDADAHWIALMHPGVGKLLADWIGTAAAAYDNGDCSHCHCPHCRDTDCVCVAPALSVARALLGGQP